MPKTKTLPERLAPDSKTGIYHVRVHTPSGTRKISTGTRNKAKARRFIKEQRLQQLEDAGKASRLTSRVVSQLVAGANITVQHAFNSYIDWMRSTASRTPKTVHNHESVLVPWVRSPKTPHMLIDVDETHISDMVNGKGPRKLKVSSRANILSVMRSFFDFCTAKGFCYHNPAKLVSIDMTGVSFAQKESQPSEPLTDQEVEKILANTTGFWRIATAFGRWAGLRLGDICQLETDCLSRPGKLVVWTDKRDRRVEVPLEPELKLLLGELPTPRGKVFFPEERATALDPAKRSTLSQSYSRLLKRLGIKGKTFKSLRVSYAQACLRAGVEMPHISGRLGHASQSTTEKHYAYDLGQSGQRG